jgi:hypothetical protein
MFVSQAKFLRFVDLHQDILPQGGTPNSFVKKVASGNEFPAFICFLVNSHNKIEQDFRNSGIKIRYARQALIYMRIWNQNSEDAVFSFDHTPTDGGETEIAFRSHDSQLLETFDKMFEQHWNDAVCYSDYWRAAGKVGWIAST